MGHKLHYSSLIARITRHNGNLTFIIRKIKKKVQQERMANGPEDRWGHRRGTGARGAEALPATPPPAHNVYVLIDGQQLFQRQCHRNLQDAQTWIELSTELFLHRSEHLTGLCPSVEQGMEAKEV